MQQTISFRLLPSEAADDTIIKQYISRSAGVPAKAVSGFHILKRSIDARGKKIWINLSLLAFINEPFVHRSILPFSFREVNHSPDSVVIIGAGPAGLFAALKLLEAGIKPIILERGKDVRSRRRDLALLNKEGIVNSESNYCFGEGGAGTYSDGKLYTRSSKRGDINRILNLFVHFGAEDNILFDAHPHIGTNKLPQIITAMRQQITDSGGEFHFEKKVTGLVIEKGTVIAVKTADNDTIKASHFILATGHSARDIFQLMHQEQLLTEAKPFALGVRIEHPQEIIDSIQYHCTTRDINLPAASYSLVQQVNEQGVFSFCMCPGGIIAPASTSPGELVVNGWSPSKRNNPFANSGMVVTVGLEDVARHTSIAVENNPFALMQFQQLVEQACYKAGGGKMVAPAQRMADFSEGKNSASLPACSYLPGLNSVNLQSALPEWIYRSLAKAFVAFGKKMPGYFTNEAVVVATESRTSSPVRIPRNNITLTHPQLDNFFPCGEGAGYAGGIVSAAMDGERVAGLIIQMVNG